jgi:8-oxo-dGTP diphosphatase
MSPEAAVNRKLTRVAVGVLLREDGRVLLADRPAGKPYAGHWEFPGGKIEPGEPVAAALGRELHEELGIEIGPSTPWVTFEFDYPHAYVELQFRLVSRWRGSPDAREGQRLRFVDPAGELPAPLLPAAVPVLRWLRLPRSALLLTPQQATTFVAAERSRPVQPQPMIVIEARWDNAHLASVPLALRQSVPGRLDWLMAAGPGARDAAGWDGVVLDAQALAADAGCAAGRWKGAWIDSESELHLAARRGCDFVLLRSAAAVAVVKGRPSALPAYFPDPSPAEGPPPGCRGRWIDARPSASVAANSTGG